MIIGAGPAGLTAAYELAWRGVPAVILERAAAVGGLAQTVNHKGYLFDIGGHRFFTKIQVIEDLWKEVLGEDFQPRRRLSRIYYNSRFFRYPLEPANALKGLGLVESLHCGLSYLRALLWPVRPEDNFEAWVSNRFGRRLFRIFFKTYTEKVWGIPCQDIEAEWAAQRIKGLSLRSAVWSALRPRPSGSRSRVIKTLIHEFHYPRQGPGMMWRQVLTLAEQKGSRALFERPVEKIFWEPGGVRAVQAGGERYESDHFISSMPIRDLIRALDPAPPAEVRSAADDFHYRDFLTVALILKGRDLFPDTWIYVHDPNVRVGRIQNYKNWSPDMVPDPETTCLGLEYFCFEGDDLWSRPDEELIDLGLQELIHLKLVRARQFLDGAVVRMPKAYPVYDRTYRRGLAAVRGFLATVPNLQLVGRNGMHRYNNQDHSMLTGLLAARNILGEQFDLWAVNTDGDYHEDGPTVSGLDLESLASTQPRVPRRVGRR